MVGGVPAKLDVHGRDCFEGPVRYMVLYSGANGYKCVSGKWTKLYWMVRRVLSFSLIKNDENPI